jgi:hypothetical protein
MSKKTSDNKKTGHYRAKLVGAGITLDSNEVITKNNERLLQQMKRVSGLIFSTI